jgi:hypothetical protein
MAYPVCGVAPLQLPEDHFRPKNAKQRALVEADKHRFEEYLKSK